MHSRNVKAALWIDVVLSVLFGVAGMLMLYRSKLASDDAVRKYGHNADSGAIEQAVAIAYFLPVALLFAVAAVAMRRSWALKWHVHWVIVVLAIAPVALELAGVWL